MLTTLKAACALIILIGVSQCKKFQSTGSNDPVVLNAQGLGKMKNSEGRFIVSNLTSGSLSFIDDGTRTVTTTITIANSQPYYSVYLPLKDNLYVTDAGNHAVQVIDAGTQTVTGSIPMQNGTIMHITGNERKSRLWVVNNTEKTVTEINANNEKIVYTLQLPYVPHDVAVNANGTKLYVSLNKGGIWNIDTYSTDLEATGNYKLIDSRAFGSNFLHLFYSAVNDKLYAADQGLGKFWALNPNNLMASATSVDMPGAHGLTLSADERYSYVAAVGSNKVYVYDNTSNTIVSQTTSTVSPNIHNIAVNQTNDLLLGTHSGASSTAVSSYSISDGFLTQGATINVGTNPQGITYYVRRAKHN